ncbi:hypothetical protein acsn021_12610 [Anaerocolumna cellulosilytica]|uniref:Uncharacterized protein n=1 Tax=Anaerocolumna cellulosilytica TaxID=433286 RepID=A0A6S6R2H8_9FIRM|nr:hypothetical protein [Anaerocolumna cellulosilytica]MBB5196008.1 hypothetical protein [Anaerocolumna cellulosilytica]BCJ93692.1 hypothetical protein acsn021_12610 [Anaerocolumna cellulosilytica]
MNKKHVLPLLILIIITIGFYTRIHVNGDNATKRLQRLAQVEIYSATEDKLIKTIEDKNSLITFNKNTIFTEQYSDADNNYMNKQEEMRKEVENYESQYIFVTYKKPAGLNNNKELEKLCEITTFKDTNIIMMQVSPDSIKNIAVPSEYLTFYFKVSNKVTAYLNSLVK